MVPHYLGKIKSWTTVWNAALFCTSLYKNLYELASDFCTGSSYKLRVGSRVIRLTTFKDT